MEGTYLSYGAEGYEAVDEQGDAVQIHAPRLVMTNSGRSRRTVAIARSQMGRFNAKSIEKGINRGLIEC